MRALDAEMIVLDFETTGSVAGYAVEAWQLGMVTIKKGEIVRDSAYSQLLRVGERPFNPNAPGKHHALREELQIAPPLPELWGALSNWWLGKPLVAHNTGTERKFVKQTAPMHKIGPWIDTLKLVRLAYPDLPSHALDEVIEALSLRKTLRGFTGPLEPHDALYDAFASAVLLLHLLGLPNWENARIEDLVSARPVAYYKKR